jgi:hypothetical protein
VKKILILLAILSLVAITGCSGAEKKSDNGQQSGELSKFPAWVINPSYEDALAAVGSAKIGKAGMSFARQQAMANARDQLALSIEVKVNTMFKSYVNSVGLGGEDGVDAIATSVSKQVASQTIRGSVQKEMSVIDNELYVLVVVDNSVVKEETVKAVNTSMANERALWQEFKADQGQKELEAAVNQMLAN